jgi:hypothetical protein
MFGGRWLVSTDLLMICIIPSVHWRCALGHRESVSAVPRWPPKSGSSCEITKTEVVFIRMWARRICSAVSRSCLFLAACKCCRYPVSLL